MKIFISHASANKEYGNALVDLLRGIGLREDEIVFTSNPAYGIPLSQNIFKWLKSQIADNAFVIYLLSKEYYSSVACLNEMGAAWIIENEHAILFTPDFDLNSKEFQSGAIDPREMGFRINDEERIFSFIQHLDAHFTITKNQIIITQKITKYLSEIMAVPKIVSKTTFSAVAVEKDRSFEQTSKEKIVNQESKPLPVYKGKPVLSKLIEDVINKKLKDEELILLKYVIETSRIRLGTGWQEDHETRNIKEWEEINEISNCLSSNYGSVIRKFGLRGYSEVSALTASNNPKEVKLKSEIEEQILDLPQGVMDIINEVVEHNRLSKSNEDDDLPF